MATLNAELAATTKNFKASMPAQVIADIDGELDKFIKDFKPSPLAPGTKAPEFTLPNQTGKSITLSKLLADHKAVVLIWYRGSWCPYCNTTLKVWRDNLAALKAADVKLVALTPETADESLTMREKNRLDFEVVTDDGCKVAERYGLAYEVPHRMKEVYYEALQMRMDNMNGNGGRRAARLPITGTVVIGKGGKVVLSSGEVDYRHREEPAKVIEIVKGM